MRTQNGENYREVILIRFTDDARQVSNIEELLTSNQILFLDSVRNHGINAFVESLRFAHDSILYNSNSKIDRNLKDVLFDLKILGDWLSDI